MKVLVSGAGGFLGRHLVAELIAHGHAVRAIVRTGSCLPAWHPGIEVCQADLESHLELERTFDEIDAIFHLAAATKGYHATQVASTLAGTRRLLTAMARSSVDRLIHVSSLLVYDWTRAQRVLTEDTPLLKSAAGLGAYTEAKFEQEQLIHRMAQEIGLKLTIARPGFVWGPTRNEIGGMGRYRYPFYFMFGPFSRLPLTYVSNCANCLVAMLDDAAVGETFNIIDNDHVRVWRYVLEYARRTRTLGVPVPVPYFLGLGVAKTVSSLMRAHPYGDRILPSLLHPQRYQMQFKPLRFSNRKLSKTLGWRPPLSFDECLRRAYGAQ